MSAKRSGPAQPAKPKRNNKKTTNLPMSYTATKQHVANRGVAPDEFLDQLVTWGKGAPDDIFEPNAFSDIYSSVFNTLGP